MGISFEHIGEAAGRKCLVGPHRAGQEVEPDRIGLGEGGEAMELGGIDRASSRRVGLIEDTDRHGLSTGEPAVAVDVGEAEIAGLEQWLGEQRAAERQGGQAAE